jgi:hypothetical protein
MPRSGTVAVHLGGATQARSRERRRGKRKGRLRAGDPLKRCERTETGLSQIPSPVIIEEMGSDLIFTNSARNMAERVDFRPFFGLCAQENNCRRAL